VCTCKVIPILLLEGALREEENGATPVKVFTTVHHMGAESREDKMGYSKTR